LDKLAMMLIIFGACNIILIGFFRLNLITRLLGDGFLSNLVYALIGASLLLRMFQRDTYLPFLGSTVMPCTVLEPHEPPGATKEVQVVVAPNKKVIYWAAEPAKPQSPLTTWDKAYGSYENTGVTVSNESGVAILKVREPQAYTVPMRGRLESHIHYRVCGEPGWMGEVNTVSIGEPEPFEDVEPSLYTAKIE
jgi:uncharacterized membrane protein YuzA (DUF378 family)